MGNCATVTVGAYVETCVGKPCSAACPNGSCPSGWACNSGVCNAPITPGADCSISTNYCTPSCIGKSTCAQCPSKSGCQTAPPADPCLGKLCSSTCQYGVCFNGQTCVGGICTGGIPADPCLGKLCSTTCPSGSCPSGQSCTNGMCAIPDTFDPHGCDITLGYAWCPSKISCQKTCEGTDIDIYGCDKSKGETWCARTQSCHIESTDPCNPIAPTGVCNPSTQQCAPGWCETGLCPSGQTCNRGVCTGDAAGIGGMSPQIWALLGIALLGGILISGRK